MPHSMFDKITRRLTAATTLKLPRLRAGALALWAGVALFAGLPAPQATAGELQVRLSGDYMTRIKSALKGSVGTSLLYEFDNGFFVGGTVYSAAFGNAGGLFIAGFEAGQRFRFTERDFLEAAMFYGGGGGANQVPGDGTLLRPRAMWGHDFGGFTLLAGGSYNYLIGSRISSPAVEIAIQRPLNLLFTGGHVDTCGNCDSILAMPHVRLKSAKFIGKVFLPISSRNRSGTRNISTMYLAGSEFAFDIGGNWETFVSAAGSLGGDGAGYAEWTGGIRKTVPIGAFSLFADAGIGFAGGGNVDTGGGLIGAVNAGLRLNMGRAAFIEASIGYTASANTKFQAVVPALAIGSPLGRPAGYDGNGNLVPSQWSLTAGFTVIPAHSGMRRPGTGGSGALGLVKTKADLYLTGGLFLTGQAYSVTFGDAGGFAMGLGGFGYSYPLTDSWTLNAEILGGAAAGGGINTGGGAVAAANAGAGLRITDSARLTFDAGWIRSFRGGLNGPMLSTGLKFGFTTFR